MSSNERKDITQQNYKNFMYETRHDRLFGFKTNDYLVISNNYNLYMSLLTDKAIKIYDKNEIKIFDIDTSNVVSNTPTNLNRKWRNSLYFNQVSYTDLLTDREMGGDKVIILSTEPEKLNEFTEEVIQYHEKSCKIDLDHQHFKRAGLEQDIFMVVPTPPLYFYITVDNKLSNVEIRNELLPIKLDSNFATLSTKGSFIKGNSMIEAEINNLLIQLKRATID